MKLFAALREMREHQRSETPFLEPVIDFGIVVEVGYAEEEGNPLTLKELLLRGLGSRSTVRRKLAHLIRQEVIRTRKNDSDGRSSHLFISPSSLKHLGKYGVALAATFAALA